MLIMEQYKRLEAIFEDLAANIDPVISQERPALAFILKQAGTVNDDSLAWSNKYCDYKDCIFSA